MPFIWRTIRDLVHRRGVACRSPLSAGRVGAVSLGTAGALALEFSGLPFNRPTQTALTPDGDILVADGYGNARVHKYAPDGRWLMSWGEFGTDPGQFNVVHNIACDDDGLVYIADRENYRIQVFDTAGRFVTQWHNLFFMLFLKRSFLKHHDELSRVRPHLDESEIWIGHNRADYYAPVPKQTMGKRSQRDPTFPEALLDDRACVAIGAGRRQRP
jgi:hypothetical protein